MADEDAQPPAPEALKAPPGMVCVPGGETYVGSQYDFDANPVRLVTLEAFFIDICPVTNADYAKFVEATGHRSVDGPGARRVLAQADDHPVTWIGWLDAAAYARWAGKRLPTEEEWEVAARGTDGREFPWGNDFAADKCNCRASGVGGPTAVGSYPEGVSPFGCHDMAGNVWEWTDSWFDAERTRRVLRGGGWSSGVMSVRACYRGRDLPRYSSHVYGFRCARRALR